MRGCTRGCRFCQAGMWYRPVRERSAGRGAWPDEAQVRATGHQELALASLSTTDYSGLEDVLDRLGRPPPRGARVAAVPAGGQRRGTLGPPGLAHRPLADAGAGGRQSADARRHQQERDRGRHPGGRARGLQPGTHDAQAVLHDRAAQGDGRRRAGHRRPVPADPGRGPAGAWGTRRPSAAERQRQQLHPQAVHPLPVGGDGRSGDPAPAAGDPAPGLRVLKARLALHDVDESYLEAALARGGEDMGDVIEGAWRRGARFDTWTEQSGRTPGPPPSPVRACPPRRWPRRRSPRRRPCLGT